MTGRTNDHDLQRLLSEWGNALHVPVDLRRAKALLQPLHLLDPKGQTFRYPEDKAGNPLVKFAHANFCAIGTDVDTFIRLVAIKTLCDLKDAQILSPEDDHDLKLLVTGPHSCPATFDPDTVTVHSSSWIMDGILHLVDLPVV